MANTEWMINIRNGRYLAHVETTAGLHLYSSGRNFEELQRNIKQQAHKFRLPTSSVRLPLKPVDEIDLDHATQMFMSKFVNKIDPRFIELDKFKATMEPVKKPELHRESLGDEPTPEIKSDVETSYITKNDKGYLVVYKVQEVCRFKLLDMDNFNPSKDKVEEPKEDVVVNF